jgi:hypothetical protein
MKLTIDQLKKCADALAVLPAQGQVAIAVAGEKQPAYFVGHGGKWETVNMSITIEGKKEVTK